MSHIETKYDITVIIPAHNRLWALPKAIESCRNNLCRVQLIVADDGSDDGTDEWLKTQEDVQSIREEKWGKPWAVNKAFQLAEGRYIKFLDSDDWLIPNCLDKQLQLIENSDADVVVSGYHTYKDEVRTASLEWIDCDDFIAQQLGECDSSHYSAFLFRKDFIDDIPHRTSFASANFASRDDRCFMLEVALKEPSVVIMKEPALCHRHHEKGRLQFNNNMASVGTNLQHLLIYRNILRQLEKSGRLSKRRVNAACKVLWPLAHWIAKTNLKEACTVVAYIYEINPDFVIPGNDSVAKMYRKMGFERTERILRVRRLLKYGIFE